MPESTDTIAQSDASERRQFQRYELTAYVDYAKHDMSHCHRVQNISLGGVCIHTAMLEEVGAVVDIVINFPDLEQSFATKGEVVWAAQQPVKDMGVRFLDLTQRDQDVLQQYLKALNAGRAG